jgi:putative ABC transport system permease protein
MTTFLHDLRIGTRILLKERSFFLISVVVLALGICGVTTQFSVINSALIRGLPFPAPDRLVRVALRDPSWAPERTRSLFASNLLAWADQQKSFAGLAGYFINGSYIATIHDVPERFSGSHVTDGFFALLGVKPALGRDFTAADQQVEAPRVTIISDAFWKSEFARDPNILGRTFRLNGRTATVVGVMPADYEFSRDQLWLPMFNEYSMATHSSGVGNVVGRLKPGVTLEQAAAELSGFARHAAKEFPDTNRNLTEAVVEPLLNSVVGRDARQLMTVMLVAVVAVLLIACVNVMNMQFARATRRAKELAVRGALGASRARLVAQMLTESLIVTVTGSVLGVLLAAWAVDFYSGLVSSLPGGAGLPVWLTFRIDGAVLACTLVTTAAAALVSGLLPALVASRINALDVLKEGGRGHTSRLVKRVTGGLVVGQIALTCALLIASLLLVKSVNSRYALNFGYDVTTVLAGRMNLETDYRDDDAVIGAQRKILEHLRSVPEFTAAAFTTRRNMMTNLTDAPQIEGRENQQVPVALEFVSDGYFAALGLRPLQGREFERTDTPDKPFVVLVNATFAQKYFPKGDAVGRRLRDDPAEPWRTIVGVVPDTLMQGPLDARTDGAGLFIPLAHYPQPYVTLLVRGHGAPLALRETLRRELARFNPNLAIYQLDTPQGFLRNALAQTRTVTTLFSVFALVAVVLSVVGLYGVAAFSVNQRTQEFGIRIALGATPREIMRMVLGQGLGRLAVGTLLGIGLAFALTRFGGAVLNNFLYKTNPHDPATYAFVVVLLALATLAACLIPARRATRVDPMVALRAE